MRNFGKSPITGIRSYYRRHYGILSDYVPELIAMRAGLRRATQLSLDSARYGRVRAQLEAFCDRAGLRLRTYERRGRVKILLSTGSVSDVDPAQEDRLGALFGYPDCCVQHFMSHKEDLVEPFVNGVTALLAKHDRLDFRANLFLRPSPLHLVRHFPCAIDCPKTLADAQRLLGAIRKQNQRLYEEIVHFGQSPVLYLDVCGAGIVFEGQREGARLRYTGSYCAVSVPTLHPLSTQNAEADCALFDEVAAAIELGDELVLEPTELVIHQQGQWLATFPRPAGLDWRLLSFE